MWSYNQTSASTVGTTSSASTNQTNSTSFVSTHVTGGTTVSDNFFDIAQITQTSTAEFVSGATSSTYLNSTNTTQTLTTTYESIHISFFSSLLSTQAGFDSAAAHSTSSEMTLGISSQVAATSSMFSQLATVASTVIFGTVAASTFRTEGTVYNVSSVSGGTIFITRSTVNLVSGAGAISTSTTSTATSLWNASFQYSSTTTTFTVTENAQSTVTSTRSVTLVSTASTTNSTGTVATTTTTSSVDTFTSSATTTASVSSTSYLTGSFSLPCIIATIIELNTNEWGWFVTNANTDRVESNGVSFTRTTFDATIGAGAVTGPTFTVSPGVSSTLTITITSFTSRTTASSKSTTAQSTYHVAKSMGAVPFTDTTRIATISFTSSIATTLTWSSSSTRSSSFTYISSTISTGVTSSVPTTYAGGTSLSVVTYTRATSLFAFTAGSPVPSRTISVTIASATATITYVRDSSVVATPPSVAAISIGEGWQAQSLGRLQPIGTNLVSGSASTVGSVATIWPPSIKTPIADSSTAFVIAGAVPTTLTNIKVSSRIGGYGWDSTAGSVASQTAGIHRITTCKSDSSATTEMTWTPVASTLSMSTGEGIAAEAVPLVNSISSSRGGSQFLSFSAFPST